MKYIKLFEQHSIKYYGQCDIIRKCDVGEKFWQTMMKNKKIISKNEFLSKVSLNDILDNDDSLDDFTKADPDTYFAKSIVNNETVYFLCTHGFEFIWK